MRLGQDNLIHDNKRAASSVGIYRPIDGRWKMPIPQTRDKADSARGFLPYRGVCYVETWRKW